MYRQGDVLIVELSDRDVSLKYASSDNVLVYGEATGHAHRVEGDAFTIYNTRGGKVIHAEHMFHLVHDEHDTIDIPEGYYYVLRQREYDEKEIRYVND